MLVAVPGDERPPGRSWLDEIAHTAEVPKRSADAAGAPRRGAYRSAGGRAAGAADGPPAGADVRAGAVHRLQGKPRSMPPWLGADPAGGDDLPSGEEAHPFGAACSARHRRRAGAGPGLFGSQWSLVCGRTARDARSLALTQPAALPPAAAIGRDSTGSDERWTSPQSSVFFNSFCPPGPPLRPQSVCTATPGALPFSSVHVAFSTRRSVPGFRAFGR